MSPVWRPLLTALAIETKVTWVADARRVPPWLSSTGVPAVTQAAEQPAIRSISCASPRPRNPGGGPLGQAPPRPGCRSSPDRHRDGIACKLG